MPYDTKVHYMSDAYDQHCDSDSKCLYVIIKIIDLIIHLTWT